MASSILEVETTLVGLVAFKANDNIFTYQNTFTNYCPISTVGPTLSNHITTKNYVDTSIVGSSILATNNTFTGTNTFSNQLTLNNVAGIQNTAPTLSNHIVTKNYVDNSSHTLAGYAKLSDNQIFTGTNQFTKGITCGSSGGMSQNIQPTLITGQFDLLTNSTAAVVFGNALNSCIWRWNGFLEIFNTKNITSNYTIAFPLQENYIIRTTTSDLTINLPLIDANKIGLRITIVKSSNQSSKITLVPAREIIYYLQIKIQ